MEAMFPLHDPMHPAYQHLLHTFSKQYPATGFMKVGFEVFLAWIPDGGSLHVPQSRDHEMQICFRNLLAGRKLVLNNRILNDVRDYFSEPIAFYFAFIRGLL